MTARQKTRLMNVFLNTYVIRANDFDVDTGEIK